MGERDAAGRGHGRGGGHARHHLERHPGVLERPCLLAAATENGRSARTLICSGVMPPKGILIRIMPGAFHRDVNRC